jgi:hypothetical protein
VQVGTYPTRNFALAVTSQAPQPGFDRDYSPGGPIISADLSTSPWSTDCLFPEAGGLGARRTVSEGSVPFGTTSLLIVRTDRVVTAAQAAVASDTRSFQHIARNGSLGTLGPFVLLLPRNRRGGWLISDHLSRSPVRPDYLISTADRGRARRIVSEDSLHGVATLASSVHTLSEEKDVDVVRVR